LIALDRLRVTDPARASQLDRLSNPREEGGRYQLKGGRGHLVKNRI
jgi:hypothetical protein|tara:strand:+ start:450 stop:587 length:138 start_codon:yes stop_codon:yes gene_type:complete